MEDDADRQTTRPCGAPSRTLPTTGQTTTGPAERLTHERRLQAVAPNSTLSRSDYPQSSTLPLDTPSSTSFRDGMKEPLESRPHAQRRTPSRPPPSVPTRESRAARQYPPSEAPAEPRTTGTRQPKHNAPGRRPAEKDQNPREPKGPIRSLIARRHREVRFSVPTTDLPYSSVPPPGSIHPAIRTGTVRARPPPRTNRTRLLVLAAGDQTRTPALTHLLDKDRKAGGDRLAQDPRTRHPELSHGQIELLELTHRETQLHCLIKWLRIRFPDRRQRHRAPPSLRPR